MAYLGVFFGCPDPPPPKAIIYIFVHLTVFYAFIAPVTLHLQLLEPPPPSDFGPPPLRPVLDTPLLNEKIAVLTVE